MSLRHPPVSSEFGSYPGVFVRSTHSDSLATILDPPGQVRTDSRRVFELKGYVSLATIRMAKGYLDPIHNQEWAPSAFAFQRHRPCGIERLYRICHLLR